MLQNVFRGLCCHAGGIILVAGTIGLLTGVKQLMSIPPGVKSKERVARYKVNNGVDRFTIRRTRSELGYTFWVLQGFGRYRGFTLFDTWQEAISEVERRTSFPVRRLAAVSPERVTV
jgi:hypothetical protein